MKDIYERLRDRLEMMATGYVDALTPTLNEMEIICQKTSAGRIKG